MPDDIQDTGGARKPGIGATGSDGCRRVISWPCEAAPGRPQTSAGKAKEARRRRGHKTLRQNYAGGSEAKASATVWQTNFF